jgi:hypothetical protein
MGADGHTTVAAPVGHCFDISATRARRGVAPGCWSFRGRTSPRGGERGRQSHRPRTTHRPRTRCRRPRRTRRDTRLQTLARGTTLFVFAHLGACIVAVYGDSPEGNFGEHVGRPSPQLELSSEVLLDLPEYRSGHGYGTRDDCEVGREREGSDTDAAPWGQGAYGRSASQSVIRPIDAENRPATMPSEQATSRAPRMEYRPSL